MIYHRKKINNFREKYHSFKKYYLGTEAEDRICEVTEKISFLCCLRMIHKLHEKEVSEAERPILDCCLKKLAELTEKLDTLTF